MELVPVPVADFITRNSSLITEGMGCGSVCDTQYLFSCDVLGTNRERIPRHAKKYANLAEEEDRLQRMRVDAFRSFVQEVMDGSFPRAENELSADPEALEALLRDL